MKKVRVVSYAINGRGLGHLVRQLSILRWVRRYAALLGVPAECWVLTTSEADTLARREGIPAFKMPSKAMMRDAGIDPTRWLAVSRQWVMNAVAGLSPDVLVVDTFPGGSFGELVPVLEMVPTRVLVARAVRDAVAGDDAYRALLPLYQRTIVPDDRGVGPILLREREELLDRSAARAALGITGDRAVYVTLGGGGDEACARVLPGLTERLVARGWHVVVGAGPLYIGPERRGPNITWIDRYVPLELLQGVDAAVSAGGYNAVTELMFAGIPTVFLPQPRIADDQDGRALLVANAGAGRLATSVEQIPDLLESAGDPAAARALVTHNGARAAAAAVLSTVLPEADVAMAHGLLSPALWARAHRVAGASAIDLASVVAGDAPSVLREREAVLAELLDARALVEDGAVIATPDNGHAHPDNGNARPDNGHARPDNSPAQPDTGPARPDNSHTHSDNGHTRADNGHARPDNGHARPDNGNARPDNGDARPDNGDARPVRRRALPATVRVDRFLTIVEDAQAPGETAIAIVRALRRKFPSATLDAIVDACGVLFPVWSRFADWMGAVSLINALPVQRMLAIDDATPQLASWLATQDDLFDALRTFARLEGNGARSLAEVLRALGTSGAPPIEVDA